jgi:predicted  nucleic acid-binding Zn-ribbon protein
MRLLELQALDSRLDQLAHRRKNLPEHAEVERLTARLAQLRDLVVAAQTEEGDIAREQAKAEADVDQVRARAARDQERLNSGRISSPKELSSLQHEIGSLAKRQADLEDTVLEIMERHEEADGRITELTAAREATAAELAEVEQRRDAAFAEIDSEASGAAGQRKELAASMPRDLVALYEKIREAQGGVGAASLRQRRCEGCRLELDITDFNRVRDAPPDAVLRCEECRRILIRTPQSGL